MENLNRTRYLESIRSFCEKWRDRYSFFRMESNQAGPCGGLCDPFELWAEVERLRFEDDSKAYALPLYHSEETSSPEVSVLKEHNPKLPRPLPLKTDRMEALSALRPDAQSHVLLNGVPGSGRSVTLVRLLLEEAHKAEEDSSHRLPVFVELRYFESSVKDLIAEFLRMHGETEFSSDEIDRMLAESELFLLFDGIDELPFGARNKGNIVPLDQLLAFERTYPSVPMIFTSGTARGASDWELANRIELAPLTRDQVCHFVRKHVSQGTERMLSNVEYGRNDPATTPLFLSMLCAVFQSDKRLAGSSALTFRRFTHIAFEQIKDRLSLNLQTVALRFLPCLAFTMLEKDSSSACRFTLPRSEAEEIFIQWLEQNGFGDLSENAGSLLNELLEHHIMEHGQGNTIEFPHQSLRDYYAAEHLLKLFPDIKRETLQQQYMNCTKWSEPLALMAGLVDSRAKTVELVKLALEVDAHYGARLAGSVHERYRGGTVSMVNALDQDPLYRVLLLSATHSDAAVTFLGEFLRTMDMELRAWATVALGEIASEEAVQLLGRVLRDPEREVQRYAVFALGNIGDNMAVQLLRGALHDPDEDLRRSVMQALGTMPSQETFLTLVQAIREPDEELRRLAAEALGNVGGHKAAQELVRVLKDPDQQVRYIAAAALGHLAAREAVPTLTETLEDPDLDVRCQAAEALGAIGSEEAVAALCESLEDPDKELRWMAATALGAIGSKKAVQPLCRALGDPDKYLRWLAAEALGNIGSEESVSPLCQALKDPDEYLRWRAAEALGKIGSKDTIQLLADALRDPDEDVRWAAAQALGNNGSAEAVQLIIHELKTGDEEVRWDLIRALRTINTERAVHILAQALDDPDKDLRWAAVQALGNMSHDHAIPLLLCALNDPDEDLQQSAALQLGNFGCEEALPMLLPALQDSDEATAWSAATALAYIGRDEAVPVLSSALEDGGKFDRRQSIDCLESIASKEVIQPLSQALMDRDEEVRLRAALALAAVGSKEAVPPLIQVIRNLDAFVRRQVAEAERTVSDDQATRPLDELLEEKTSQIREAVAKALHQLADVDVLATLRDAVTDDFDPFLYQCMLSMQDRLGIRNPDFLSGA